MYIGAERPIFIKIWNEDIVDYRQFDTNDNRYIYFKKRELKLLRNNEKNLIKRYKRIKLYGKRIVDYRQFSPSQFQYKCYMDIENDLIINQSENDATYNDTMNTHRNNYFRDTLPCQIIYTYQYIPSDETYSLPDNESLPSYNELYTSQGVSQRDAPPSYNELSFEQPPIYTNPIPKKTTFKFIKSLYNSIMNKKPIY
jgi:hypothetical protein